jgi:hypothetical protein
LPVAVTAMSPWHQQLPVRSRLAARLLLRAAVAAAGGERLTGARELVARFVTLHTHDLLIARYLTEPYRWFDDTL